MKIDAIAKGLDAGHHTRKKLCAGRCLEVFEESLPGKDLPEAGVCT